MQDVQTTVCEACSNGCHDILRPCKDCGRSVVDKANLRGAMYGVDRHVEAVVFCAPSEPTRTR